jgi:hypothetical protein
MSASEGPASAVNGKTVDLNLIRRERLDKIGGVHTPGFQADTFGSQTA